MKLTKILVAAIAPLITLVPQFTSIANAQSFVRGGCNAAIVGSETGSRINMRSGPGVEFDLVGYVLVGQQVNRLRYDGGAGVIERDNQGIRWSYVEYIPSQTRGWIREDFLGSRCLS